MKPGLINKIFNISGQKSFYEKALEVFNYQAENNKLYKEFLSNLHIDRNSVRSLYDIPFLPAGFFKNHKIVTGNNPVVMIFESSGTTGTSTGRHYVTDIEIYKESLTRAFTLFYGNPSQFFIAALLPSYIERENSSLVYMVNNLVERSAYPCSGFYKNNIEEMLSNIKVAREKNRKILLIGVSFALLDLAEKYSPDLSDAIVMETGGMKGRRNEMIREELHSVLRQGLRAENIHSEYGMTELLSQAYSKSDGIFHCPPWMKILIRDPQDPLSVISIPGRTGGINVIDLANINSCSFISTDDLGKLHEDGGFEVLGRFDNSDIRGCNLLAEQGGILP
jgi:phenylacetate-coenzyme A ligase PaaK-like adenylate-forming protein